MSRKIVVSRLWKKKGIQQYFSLLQLSKEFWDFEVDAHILIDDGEHKDDWSGEIDRLSTPHRPKFPMKVTFYSMSEIEGWYISNGLLRKEECEKLKSFVHIYHILLYYYLLVEKGVNYLVTYDDDIFFNKKAANSLSEIDGLVESQIPFVVNEDFCPMSDKGMFYKLSQHFGRDLTSDYHNNNPNGVGANAGFMGIDLYSIFHPFINKMDVLLSLFEFKTESTPDEIMTFSDRRLYDTQEQSFLSIMSHCFSTKPIFRLGNSLGYFFDTPIQEAINKSKLIHFTGDRKYDPIFPKVVIDFLKNNGHNNITTEWFYY